MTVNTIPTNGTTIKFLSGIQHIQTRPGMYANTDTPKTLVKELIDNALDEVLNGYATRIEVTVDQASHSITVQDNGRGLPTYRVPELRDEIAAKLLFTEIFCLAEDTPILLLDGTSVPIQDIEQIDPQRRWVYSFDVNSKQMVPGRIDNVKRTGIQVPTVTVRLQNELYTTEVNVTTNHRFLLSNGLYKEAKDLSPRDSLESIYFFNYPGYSLYSHFCTTSKGKGRKVHQVVNEHFNGWHEHVHHIDEDIYNNLPHNLQGLTKAEHDAIHMRERNLRNWQDEQYRATQLPRIMKHVENYTRSDVTFADIVRVVNDRDRQWNKWRIAHELLCSAQVITNRLAAQGYSSWSDFVRDHNVNVTRQSGINHSVVEVVPGPTTDVYDLHIPEFHNFAIDDGHGHGIFVHNSGGKFGHENYKYSVGLHGVGLTVVNALSSRVDVEVYEEHEERTYTLILADGQEIYEGFTGTLTPPWYRTSVTCTPNPQYFRSKSLVYDLMNLQLAAGTCPDATIIFNGEPIAPYDFRQDLNEDLLANQLIHVHSAHSSLKYDIQFGWSQKEFNKITRGSVNLGPCHQGWHDKTVRYKVNSALHSLYPDIKTEDFNYGSRMFISILTSEPTFTSQTKERLSWCVDDSPVSQEQLLQDVTEALKDPSLVEFLDSVAARITAYTKQLQNLSDTDFINSVVRKGSDKRARGSGSGIWDCSTGQRSRAELFIVEGKSAAGHIRRTRNATIQAVLPLRGKPMNVVVRDDIKSILMNREIVQLVNSIGAGISPKTDLSAMRYGKILIATDADSDGFSICNLILGALIFLVPEVVDAGKVYEIQAPLYEQNGQFYYDLSDINPHKPFTRFKGLGSMNPDEVERTIVNPTTRRVRQITLDDRASILDILQTSRAKKEIMTRHGIVVEAV